MSRRLLLAIRVCPAKCALRLYHRDRPQLYLVKHAFPWTEISHVDKTVTTTGMAEEPSALFLVSSRSSRRQQVAGFGYYRNGRAACAWRTYVPLAPSAVRTLDVLIAGHALSENFPSRSLTCVIASLLPCRLVASSTALTCLQRSNPPRELKRCDCSTHYHLHDNHISHVSTTTQHVRRRMYVLPLLDIVLIYMLLLTVNLCVQSRCPSSPLKS